MDLNSAVLRVLENTGFSLTDMASDKRTKITVHELFRALIELKDRESAAISLNISKSKLEYILKTRISPLVLKIPQEQWHVHLLGLADLRRCYKCNEIKDLSEFISDKSRHSGVNGQCKVCARGSTASFRIGNPEYSREYRQAYPQQHREYCATYNATKLGATPIWANLDKIKDIYANCPKGMHVDHIVPLRGNNVCGLHVEYNLQYLTPEENLKKSNKYSI